MEEETQIDPTTGITPEISNFKQDTSGMDTTPASSKSLFSEGFGPKRTNVTQQRSATGVKVGTDLFGNSNFERVTDKYGETNVFNQDFEQLRAKEQPIAHQALGFLNQAIIGEIVGGTIEGVGYLLEIPTAIKGLQNSEKEFGNMVTQFGAGIKESANEATPIYQTGSGWDPGNSGWWFKNGVSIASSLSLMIPAMGVSKGLGVLGKGLGSLGKLGKGTSKLIQGGTKSAQIFRKATTQAVVSRHMENMMEAKGSYDDTYQKHLAAGRTEEEARVSAGEAAASNYNFGWAMLAQDIIQYGMMAKFKNPLTGRSVNKIEEGIYDSLGKLGKAGQFLGKNRAIGGMATAFVSEAGEEAYQFIAAEESKYLADIKAGIEDESSFGERMGDYAKDGDMWSAAFFGGFGGMAMDAVGSRGSKKEREAYLEKQNTWIRQHGSQMGKMADAIAKADETGDVSTQVASRTNLGVKMTIQALENDSFDFHIDQMNEWMLSPEALEKHNKENPDNQLSQEFVENVLPSLIEDAHTLKDMFTENYEKGYAEHTLGAIVNREFLAQKFQEKAEAGTKARDNAVEKAKKGFNISSEASPLLENELQVQQYQQQIAALEATEKNSENKNTQEWAKEERMKIEPKLSGALNKSKELRDNDTRTQSEKKSDEDSIALILSDKDVQQGNLQAGTNPLYARKEYKEAQYLKSEEFQSNAIIQATEALIVTANDLDTTSKLRKSIEQANMSDETKKRLLNNLDRQEQIIKEKVSEQQSEKEEAEREAAAVHTPEEVKNTPGVTTEQTTEEAEGPGVFEFKGEETPVIQETPVVDETIFTSEDPFQMGDEVKVKAGSHKNRLGRIVGKESDGRFKVEFTSDKRISFGSNNLDKVAPVTPEVIQKPLEESKQVQPYDSYNTILEKSAWIRQNTDINRDAFDTIDEFVEYFDKNRAIFQKSIDNNESKETTIKKAGYTEYADVNESFDTLVAEYDLNTSKPLTPEVKTEETTTKADIERRRQKSLIPNPTYKDGYTGNRFWLYTDANGRESEGLSSTENLVKEINAKYDAEYVDAVKKGEMTKEQAMQALEEVGRKDSEAYAELAALEPTQQTSETTKEADPLPQDVLETPIQPTIWEQTEANQNERPDEDTVNEVPQDDTKVRTAGNLTVVTNYQQPGWKSWLSTGPTIIGAKVIIEPVPVQHFHKNVDGAKLASIFAKLKAGEEVSEADMIYFVDKYPISFTVLDKDGSKKTINGNYVFAYVYMTNLKFSDVQIKDIRNARWNILKELVTNGSYTTELSAKDGSTTNELDNTKNSGETLENNLDVLDTWVKGDTKKALVVVNQDGNYVDENGSIDKDLAKKNRPHKKDGNSSAGNIFLKIDSPNGALIPVKLNTAKVSEAEAEILFNIYKDILSHPNDPSYLKAPVSAEVLEQIKKVIPNYTDLLSANPTNTDVINLLIYVDTKAVDVNNAKPGDMTLKQGVLKFNFLPILEEIIDEDGKSKSVPQVIDGNKQYSAVSMTLLNFSEKKKDFIDYMTNVKRRNIDFKKLKSNKAYFDYIIENNTLNTDISEQVFKTNLSGINVKVNQSKSKLKSEVTPIKPAETVRPVIAEAIEVTKPKKATTENEAVPEEGAPVSPPATSAAVKKLTEQVKKLNPKKKHC